MAKISWGEGGKYLIGGMIINKKMHWKDKFLLSVTPRI